MRVEQYQAAFLCCCWSLPIPTHAPEGAYWVVETNISSSTAAATLLKRNPCPSPVCIVAEECLWDFYILRIEQEELAVLKALSTPSIILPTPNTTIGNSRPMSSKHSAGRDKRQITDHIIHPLALSACMYCCGGVSAFRFLYSPDGTLAACRIKNPLHAIRSSTCIPNTTIFNSQSANPQIAFSNRDKIQTAHCTCNRDQGPSYCTLCTVPIPDYAMQ
jgi:hypothetical protein